MKDNTYQSTLEIPKTSKINQLISEDRLDEALTLADKLLEKDSDSEYLIKKAEILAKKSKFSEAVDCINDALYLNNSSEILSAKADILYNYAKITFFPENNYEKALDLIDNALNIKDDEEFHFLKAEILEAMGRLVESHKSYLIAHGELEKLEEFEKQSEYIENTTDILFNITGEHFYNFTPENGIEISLVKDDENEHDPDAVAVLLDGEKIAYVANSDYTVMKGLKSASDIKNLVDDTTEAEILFVYLDYIVCRIR